MNQFEKILALMKENGGKVYLAELKREYLYHKAASRLGDEAERKGYVIRLKKGDGDDYYELLSEPQDASISSGNGPVLISKPIRVALDGEQYIFEEAI